MGTSVETTFDPEITSTKAIQQQESWDQLVERTLRKEQEHKERKMRKQQLLLEKMSEGDLSMLTSYKHRSTNDNSARTTSSTNCSSHSENSKVICKSEGAASPTKDELDIIVSSKPVLEKPKAANLSLSQSSSRTNGSRLKVSYSVDELNDDEEDDC